MMMVSSSFVFVNRLRAGQSAPAGAEALGFEASWEKSERIGRRRSGDLKAPATSVSPEIDLIGTGAVTGDLQAAAGSVLVEARKYTSSGVA
jgi:hypothetical protein